MLLLSDISVLVDIGETFELEMEVGLNNARLDSKFSSSSSFSLMSGTRTEAAVALFGLDSTRGLLSTPLVKPSLALLSSCQRELKPSPERTKMKDYFERFP